MTEREALKLALEALDHLITEFRIYDLPYGSKAYTKGTDAIRKIQAVLVQPEQEPMALIYDPITGSITPPQRKPLTDEQRDAIARQAAENDWHDYKVIDAVEAAHGIKGEA